LRDRLIANCTQFTFFFGRPLTEQSRPDIRRKSVDARLCFECKIKSVSTYIDVFWKKCDDVLNFVLKTLMYKMLAFR
jgi:hypothetical protein